MEDAAGRDVARLSVMGSPKIDRLERQVDERLHLLAGERLG